MHHLLHNLGHNETDRSRSEQQSNLAQQYEFFFLELEVPQKHTNSQHYAIFIAPYIPMNVKCLFQIALMGTACVWLPINAQLMQALAALSCRN